MAALPWRREVYPRDKSVLEEHGDRAVFGFGFVPRGYGWVFPKKDHFSVGIGTTRTHARSRLLYRQFQGSASFLKEADEG